MCLRGSLKCVESGEGEHPDGGPPGPWPAPGKRRHRELPAPSQDPRLRRPGPFPCALGCFLRLTRREGKGGKDPCGCPLPITNIVSCRWLPHFLIQLTQRLPTLWKCVASEPRPAPALTTWITTYYHAGQGVRMGEPVIHCLQSSLVLQSPSPQQHPEKGEGWGRTCGEGSRGLLVLKCCAPSQGLRSPSSSQVRCEYCL